MPGILPDMRGSCVLLACFLGGALLFAQTPPSAVPTPNAAVTKAAEEVKTYCESIAEYKKDATPLFFADASDQPKPAWRKVNSERELEALSDALFQHATTAKVWLKDKKVVALETETTAGTSDWLINAEYCYRLDGTLASIHSEFRNDKDEYISVRDEAYDANGTLLGETVNVLDLRSRRPKKISKQMAAAEVRAALYPKASELPFQKLLNAK